VSQLKVCIFCPSGVYSETFIKNHLVYLPFDKYILNGVDLSSLTYREKPLLAFTSVNRIKRKLARMLKQEHYFEKRRLTAFLKENKIQVVLAEYGHIGTIIYEACRQLDIPLVVHFHGNDASHRPTLELLGKAYLEMFDYASSIVTVSRAMTERLRKLGAPADKLIYNCYGIDTSLFQTADKKRGESGERGEREDRREQEFVAVGRFVEKKAPHLTILAFAMARKKNPLLRLTMVGTGELMDVCKQLVKAYGLGDSVEFAGIKSPAEVAAIVAGALAFVQHSVIAGDGGAEGTPLAILEAGACGVPVISTRHEGIKDVVIEGETGLLVDEFDVEGMAKVMEFVAAHPAEAERMGKNARAHIEKNYTLTSHIDILAGIISSAYTSSHEPKR
jgi:colanic acid/amylovoran biosynthesis glycosyltransferase